MQNYVGVIDGTHVQVCVSAENQILFIDRKGVLAQNIMAACSYDMSFIFVWVRWENRAHDTRIFLDVIDNHNIKILKPLEGTNQNM